MRRQNTRVREESVWERKRVCACVCLSCMGGVEALCACVCVYEYMYVCTCVTENHM